MEPHRLLFVCTANICRSPMAEGLSLMAGRERGWNVQALSCGVHALDGHPAAPNSVKAMREIGGDIRSHLAQPASEELVAWADRILVMEIRHASHLRERYPEADEKTQLLGVFGGTMEIADPYGKWIFAYRRCRDQLRGCVDSLLDSLPPRPL